MTEQPGAGTTGATGTLDAAEIDRAVSLLRAGELVAFPTETVYGLGADARNSQAVSRIFEAKGRPKDHPLIVHLASAEAMDAWAREVPEFARRLAVAFWPGPLTLILKRQPGVPDAVTGGQDTVGLRVPNHPVALALLNAFAGGDHGGLAAPSANQFGRLSPTTAEHVREELGDRVAMVLDGGACAVGIESTIVDCSGEVPRILRPGGVLPSRLAAALDGTPVSAAGRASEGEHLVRAPGGLAAHYAPRTPLVLLSPDGMVFALRAALAAGRRSGVLAPFAAPLTHDSIVWRVSPGDPSAFARDLYSNLRELDAAGVDRIFVPMPPDTEPWQAVRDRLQRAATGSGMDADET